MKLSSIPFTYHWIMKKVIGFPKTLLDLGCGNGDFSYDLFKNNYKNLILIHGAGSFG
jgi:ribosomal protein L11 methylase PrmA